MKKFNARKEEHFIGLFEKFFAPYRDKDIRFLEIGVQDGGSMKMWESYFPSAEIVGVDNDKNCLQYETERVSVHIGDQADREFMEGLGQFDIVIDDGGHKMSQHRISFDVLFPKMPKGSLYIIEDLHTCYMDEYVDDRATTEWLKECIDEIQKEGAEYSIKAIHVYKSIVIIEK